MEGVAAYNNHKNFFSNKSTLGRLLLVLRRPLFNNCHVLMCIRDENLLNRHQLPIVDILILVHLILL